MYLDIIFICNPFLVIVITWTWCLGCW